MPFDPERFALVKGGVFEMGDARGGFASGSAASHTVRVGDYFISKYPVTQGEWREAGGGNPSNFRGDALPVEMISWLDAVCFCNMLSGRAGLAPCYEINGGRALCDFGRGGYRLPTEAEWEYAARSGNISGDWLYSGSDDLDEVGWYKNNARGATHAVGLKKPNGLGIFDMSGNVWEWCWDWHGAYAKVFAENPSGPLEGAAKVARGGSWLDFAYGCTVAVRSGRKPSLPQSDVGMRLARTCV